MPFHKKLAKFFSPILTEANTEKNMISGFSRNQESTLKKKPKLIHSGFQGIGKIHKNSILPRKKSKNKPLTKEVNAYNRTVSSKRIGNENAIGFIKRFKIVSERYRNRWRSFG